MSSIPAIDGRRAVLLRGEGDADDNLIALEDASGGRVVVAFVDGNDWSVYRLEGATGVGAPDPRQEGESPIVIVTGDLEGPTGQVKILEDDGVYRRYSRWDKVDPEDFPGIEGAYLQSLPQCGCGGYLGAPTVFPTFAEMVSYFYMVFVYAL